MVHVFDMNKCKNHEGMVHKWKMVWQNIENLHIQQRDWKFFIMILKLQYGIFLAAFLQQQFHYYNNT